MVEWYWQGKREVLGERPALVLLFHHKSHMDWPGVEPRLFQGEEGAVANHLSHGMGGAAELWTALHDKQWLVTGWNESGCTVTDYCGHCNTVWIIFKLISEHFFLCFVLLELLCETFDVRYVLLTVVTVSTILWDVMPCSQRGKCQYVGWICGLHKWQISLSTWCFCTRLHGVTSERTVIIGICKWAWFLYLQRSWFLEWWI